MGVERVLLLWDVDHTLIENGGASKATYSGAFALLINRAPAVRPDTHGRTDLEIMTNLFEANGERPDRFSPEQVLGALVLAMDDQRQLLSERGYALPGAMATLRRVCSRPEILQSALTGNIPENAFTKLSAFGLDVFLDLEVGGYGTDGIARFELVAAARGKAREKYGYEFSAGSTVLVGDTVRDVEAAQKGGALVIGVATGIHSVDDLRAAGADSVMDSLVDPGTFFHELDRLVRR